MNCLPSPNSVCNRAIFIFACALLSLHPAFGSIRGKINDQQKPVDGASVSLLNAHDSSIVKFTITDSLGAFYIDESRPGKYLVVVQAQDFAIYYSEVFTLSDTDTSFTLPLIQLHPQDKELGGVVIKSKAPLVVQKNDKLIVNVSQSITSAGSTAWEILQKAPGVTADEHNSTISLRGKNGVFIYIDGKPAYMSGEQLVNLLKNMAAGNLQSIEIIAHPSAQYDAAGNAGVINIVTKKNKMKGLSGSISSSYIQNAYASNSNNASLNYRTGKINVYANGSYSFRKSWMDYNITRKFYTPDSGLNLVSNQYNHAFKKEKNYDCRLGASYYINNKNTLNLLVSAGGNLSLSDGYNNTRFVYPSGLLQSSANTINSYNQKWHNITYDINYKVDFDTSGKSLTAGVTYTDYNSTNDQDFRTHYFNGGGNLVSTIENPGLRRGSLPSDITIAVGKIDYTQPLKSGITVDIGLKSSLITSDNNVHYSVMLENNWTDDSSTNNYFRYKENINAGYINVSKQFNAGWTLKAGVRGEQTISDGYQYVNDSTVHRNYFQLFPTFYLEKKINDAHMLGFSFGSRIDRPSYQDLNPFIYYLDPYTYGIGSPFLRAQITNSAELSYKYKSILSAALDYSHTKDVISQIIYQNNATLVTYQTQENIRSLENISLNISSTIPFTKWFSSYNNLNIYRSNIQGNYRDEKIDMQQVSLQLNSTNTFELPRNYSVELSGFYVGPSFYGLFRIAEQHQVSLGMQKKILKQKGAMIFNLNDIFNTLYSKASMKLGNVDIVGINNWDNRKFTLTFTYNFSRNNMKVQSANTPGNEDEQNRIKK